MDEIKTVIVNDMSEPPSEVLTEVEIKCIECGEGFKVSPAEQKFYIYHNYDLPKRCPRCRIHKRDKTDFVCVDCGTTFQMDASTISFYKRNDLNIPKRCPSCREIKKNKNENK